MLKDVAIMGVILSVAIVLDEVLFDGRAMVDGDDEPITTELPSLPNLLTLK